MSLQSRYYNRVENERNERKKSLNTIPATAHRALEIGKVIYMPLYGAWNLNTPRGEDARHASKSTAAPPREGKQATPPPLH